LRGPCEPLRRYFRPLLYQPITIQYCDHSLFDKIIY
jgi:hypothetical protein